MAGGRDYALELQPLTSDVDGMSDGAPRSRETRCHPSLFQNSIFRTAVYIGALITGWYILSTSLSLYNKKLLGKNYGIFGKGSFPAPLLMSSLQFLFQNLIAKAVFKVGLMKRTVSRDSFSWREYCRTIVPNGITTGLDIGFSNMSLVFINLSFYTMCKATSPVFLLLFAFIWGIERPSCQLAGVVSIIVSGLVLLVAGEADFDPLGFILAMLAACLSGLRFTLTQILLHGHHDKHAFGSPLEVLEALTPIMAASTLVMSLLCERLWASLPSSPYFSSPSHAAATLAVIMLGAAIAFCMVWCEYVLVSETSSLTLMVAGICKEIMTVLAAIAVFGEHLGVVNGMGLGVTIAGVVLFNYYKYSKLKAGEIAAAKVGARTGRSSKKDESNEEEPLLCSSGSLAMDAAGSVAAVMPAGQPQEPGLQVRVGSPKQQQQQQQSRPLVPYEPLLPLSSPFVVRRY